MKKIIVSLFAFAVLCLLPVCADTPADQSQPKELARQLITSVQTGKMADLRQNLASHVLILENGSKLYPEDASIHTALALCYLGYKDKLPAVKNFEKAYLLSKKDFFVGTWYAVALKANWQPLKGYELAREMSAAHPDAPQAEILLAGVGLTIQKYEETLVVAEGLLKKAPANLQARDRAALLDLLGTCYLYTGNHAKAIQTLENALVVLPGMVPTLTTLGEAFLKAGNVEQAEAALDKALAINPGYFRALYYKGLLMEQMGQNDLAQKNYNEAYLRTKQILDDNGEPYYLLHLICGKLSKPDEAAEYKAKAAQLMFTREVPWKQKTP